MNGLDSTLIYRSFYEAASLMPDEERHLLYDAIFAYSFDGVEADFNGHPWAASVFQGIKPNIDSRNKAVLDGKKGGRPKKTVVSESEKGGFSESQKGGFENSKTNTKANAKANTNVKESKRFTPPSLEEVAGYCFDRGNNIDPQAFIDYYASQKWRKANGRPVADWKACVRTWEALDKKRESDRGTTKPTIKKNAFTRFDQREYDESDLELQLLEGVRR